MGLSNYWGYNLVVMFVLYLVYVCLLEMVLDEFCDVIKVLYKVGIEVIFDIVFNYSVELDFDGLLFLLCGIDNCSYYWIREDGDYYNWIGCGNMFNLSYLVVVDYVSVCLCYWVEICYVDGFCFDLVVVMGCMLEFCQDVLLFIVIQNCLVFLQVKLIVELWDIVSGGYQVGNFLLLFVEWNDYFCDVVCCFWLYYDLFLGVFVGCFVVFSDVFKCNGCLLSVVINFVIVYDGFMFCDCVCFNYKYNEVNGEENCDGINNNYSNNYGKEGLGGFFDLVEWWCDSIYVLLIMLLFFQGMLMLLVGDEYGYSQYGNNNVYCQDN